MLAAGVLGALRPSRPGCDRVALEAGGPHATSARVTMASGAGASLLNFASGAPVLSP
jgi:hypothetical protein